MGIEIERKFLVINDSWRKDFETKMLLRQGYISTSENCVVRIRISDSEAWLTIKGANVNITRSEFEYCIPIVDAQEMLDKFAGDNVIEKIRYFIDYHGNEWIIDEFAGLNKGLVLAEIELDSEHSCYDVPSWAGKDVTDDYRYCNSSLSRTPYSSW
jgi:adenylate cyclase